MPCRPVARGCGLGGNSSLSYTSQLRLGVAVTVVRSAGPRLAQAAGVNAASSGAPSRGPETLIDSDVLGLGPPRFARGPAR
jgi:hypothetical protein